MVPDSFFFVLHYLGSQPTYQWQPLTTVLVLFLTASLFAHPGTRIVQPLNGRELRREAARRSKNVLRKSVRLSAAFDPR